YTLAGLVNPEHGWGIEGDTVACQQLLARYGGATWFRLGDRDLATHIRRTERLHQGAPLSVVTDELRRALGVEVRLLLMTDESVRTCIVTRDGSLAFQEYFVRHGPRAEALAGRFGG